MDKVVQGHGRSLQICPPIPHCILICMKLAVCSYPLRLMCSSPFNLCRSHNLPFCPTSNLHSHFILLTPHCFHSFLRFCLVWANPVARLPSLVKSLFSFCHCLPVCLTMDFSVFPRVSWKSTIQQSNEARLPSTAHWNFTPVSRALACFSKDRATLPSTVAADWICQLKSIQVFFALHFTFCKYFYSWLQVSLLLCRKKLFNLLLNMIVLAIFLSKKDQLRVKIPNLVHSELFSACNFLSRAQNVLMSSSICVMQNRRD